MRCQNLLATVASFVALTAAQVTTDCNPMEKDCPADPALGTEEMWDFSTPPNPKLWENHVGRIEYGEQGARLTVDKQGDSPTMRTKFYFFFGRVEFHMKAAPGIGIISSMMLLSDNLDEIDWEFLGANHTHASTNIFGKGIEDFTNGRYHTMPDGKPAQDEFHNYTTVWTQEKMDFYINEQLARTIVAADCISNETGTPTDIYPQTPMRMSLGIWAGGDPRLPEGTREWAGGTTNYENGPYDMFVKSAQIEDYHSGKEYIWGDRSGTWESIEVVGGNSTALNVINQKPEKSLAEKWNDLPPAAKFAVYGGAGGVGAIIIAALVFYCIKQRRRGAQEARLADEQRSTERMELAGMKKNGIDPDGFSEHSQEFNARDMKTNGTSYTALNSDEKAWESNNASTAYIGAAGVMSPHVSNGPQSPTRSPYQDVPGQTFGTPPPAMTRTQSPFQSPQSRIGSPGPQQAYGAHRMQQQSPVGGPMSPVASFHDSPNSPTYGMNHNNMQQGPSPLSPMARSFSGMSGPHTTSPGGMGYRQ